MSWESNLKNVAFSITTGDGKQWFPLWKTGERSREFNVSAFNFIDVAGTLVERKKPQSGKFPLVFWFQGADNVEQADKFDASAADNRPWTVTHPLYGTINGQPVSIKFNDEAHNITEVTVEFWESIDVDYPKSNFSVKDNTYGKSREVLQACSLSYSGYAPLPADIQKIKTSNNLTASAFTPLQTDATNADYQNALASAEKSADRLLVDSTDAINKAMDLMDMPSSYDTPVLKRVTAFHNAYTKLKTSVLELPGSGGVLGEVIRFLGDKFFFQSQGGACLASICNAAVNPAADDYRVVTEIESVASMLLEIYADYLQTVDDASVSQYDTTNAWQPDATVQSDLQDLVFYTLGNLYNLGFDSQQERVVFVPEDTNVILLTHRYLGMDASDANLELFRTINDIGLDELYRIKKGRKIKYYV